MLPVKVHRYIFLIASVLLVIGLPVSYFLLSLSQLILASNWILEGNFKHKLHLIYRRKSLLLLITIYFMHVLWLFNTANFDYAFHDLRIKLPLLALPIIYGTSDPFSGREFKLVVRFFVATVFVNSMITSYVLLGFSNIDLLDSRYASLFISHIRFALIVVLTIYTLFYFVFFESGKLTFHEKTIYTILMIWFVAFLVLLRSFTGIVIFVCLFPLAIIWWAHNRKQRNIILTSYGLSLLLAIGTILYGFYSWQRYNKKEVIDYDKLEQYTVNGNKYQHRKNCDQFENGHQIWIYISKEELKTEWNRISKFPYDSTDKKGQRLSTTLIRYLTSMGYRKDSAAIASLNSTDVEMIEKGHTNYLQKNKFALYPRIYELLWELERYNKTGNPNGQSLAQRIEYLKTGLHIIRRKFWLGTGTGDINDEFLNQYKLDRSILDAEWQRRTHNQFITFFLTFGVFGFLWFIFALFMPPFLEKRYKHPLFVIFFLIGTMSMLNEDTLESHVGVSFFAFFYAFLLFSMPDKEDADEKT